MDTLKGPGPSSPSSRRPTRPSPSSRPAPSRRCSSPRTRPAYRDLTYHVVPGKLMAADVVKYDAAKTVNGAQLKIEAGGDR